MQKEMDLVSDCQGKLASFRIKELKDVLAQLGLSKQGRKQDLVDRILLVLSDEEVSTARGSAKKNIIGKNGAVKIIADACRKIQNMESADLPTKGQSALETISLKPEGEFENSINSDVKIYCPCRSSLPTESMIQCVDPSCQVQQHIGCVIVPEKPLEGIPPVPLFYCEMCRIKRADPFWVTVVDILSPVKLVASTIPTDDTNPLQNVEKTFQLTKDDRDLLQNTEYDVQAWCILLNDSVSFRMQWPLHVDLQINGMQVRTVNRHGSQLLGANGRDDGAFIKLYIGEGINKISLSGRDARVFCFGIRLVRRRTVQQVLNLIPGEADGEAFEDALARVRRCIRGGDAGTNEDSDSDVELIADSITVSLRCPMSGSRMKVAGRFKSCAHMGCFDLEVFVELNQRSRKWQCPICLKNYSLEDIIIDPYFNRITTMMRHCGEDIMEINVKADGSWSAKTSGAFSDLAQWHFPDGSFCIVNDKAASSFEFPRQIKEEDDIKEHSDLNIGIRNQCGFTVSEHQHVVLSSRNRLEANNENSGQNVITMSSSATNRSGGDDENPSINQDSGALLESESTNDGNEITSMSHSGPTFGIQNGSSALREDADIIVLSDSEEENNLVRSLSALPSVPDPYVEDPVLNIGVSSCLGLFNVSESGNGSEIGLSPWPYSMGTQAGSAFQLFGTDSDVSDAFVDLDCTSVPCSVPMNGNIEASRSTVNSGGHILSSSVCYTSNEIDDGMVDNPMAFISEDPSLQNFLPIQSAEMLEQSNVEHPHPVLSGFEDWISLRVGSKGGIVDTDIGAHAVSAAANGLGLRNPNGSNEVTTNTDMNDEARSNRTNSRKLSGGPFSFPRQPRSVRQRTCVFQ
ncbi:LOW QUALITY PROTEIN: E3 SUMO-protein ligase SIZ1-like [Juglans microcarpa x Juglans regia]|uniref:LOW QUALITY PROTEIN: E3 SUMO-protein ligase SIZ1-like n=1 Tax=Juglans microcarpa x Juglans regia TaxID=2249226 RepID=UPI001B7ECEC5|nr:LOW QUALITY PROTEIN: E3 SUMO-protein ligase SIZ1-like [Juglans microcarpa x Juglans regia]